MSRWPEVALGEVLTQYREYIDVPEPREYLKLSVRLYGKGVVLDAPADGTTLKMKRHQLAKPGQVILSEIWGKKGAIGFVPPEGSGALCTSHFFLFDVDRSKLDPGWLQAIFTRNYLEPQLEARAFGTTGYASVRPRDLLALTIPLPPIEEQRRVVRRIEQFATLQQRAARMSVDAESKTSRLLPTAIDKLLHGRLEELPSGWNRIRVGDLGCPGVDTVQTGPFGAQLHKSDYRDEGHPVLAIGNVQWGFLDHSHVDHVSGDKATALARYALAEGDVLFTRSGTVGRSAVVPPLADGWLMTGHILRIRLDKCRALPRFVFLAMQGCSSVRSQIEEGARGATRAGFNTSLLSRVELPMPSIGEQEAIVRRLQILESQLGLVGRLQGSVSASYDALVHSALGTLLGR